MKHYINYDEKADINYSFVFALYRIAERNGKERICSIVSYKSQKQLADRIKEKCGHSISAATISRILSKEIVYLPYFTKSKAENKIILNNNFSKGKAASNKFVVLSDDELCFLLEQDSNLLTKYYLYLKYYCGYSKSKQIDTTAKQILSAIGYSEKCGNNKDLLCKYNALLVEKGYVTIQKTRDCRGHSRNIYAVKI